MNAMWSDVTSNYPGVWRYAPLCNIEEETAEMLSDKQSPEIAPPVEAPELADRLGVRKFLLLPLTFGPGGTFKDLEAAVVLAKIVEEKKSGQRLSWHSTGNTARAYREFAHRASIENYSFFPIQCLSKWNGVQAYDQSTLVAFNGPFQGVSAAAKAFAKKEGLRHLAPLDWKLAGKAPAAYPIVEFCPEATCIVQTIAGGYGPLGILQGLKHCVERGLLDQSNLPRFELFQIEGADTISRLIPLGREITETDLMLPVNPFEPTLQSTNPLSTFNHVRRLINDTQSAISSVNETSVVAEKDLLFEACSKRDIPLSYVDEKCPFISWAGLCARADHGNMRSDDVVVMLVTGSPARGDESVTPDLVLEPDNIEEAIQ